MGKHEIRLRRQRTTPQGAERFRNFGAVMKRHEHQMRIKKIMQILSLFAVILVLALIIVTYILVHRFEKRQEQKKSSHTSIIKNHYDSFG